MAVTLSWTAQTTVPVEAEAITPDRFLGLSCDEIARLPVQHGNAAATLGDFFRVEGSCDDQEIVLEGDCSRVKLIGSGMTRGRIRVRGDVGMHLGAEMRGGEIVVEGHAGDWVGAEMHGGRIHVQGNAGHLVGGAYRGSRRGMTGGTILIDGQAKNEVGGTMRRGLIAIGGAVGDFAGVGMIGGTVLVFGAPGIRAGAGMKRGTVALFGHPPESGPPPLLPTFRYDCTYRPVFLSLYLRRLSEWGYKRADAYHHGLIARYSGDLVALGLGEILVWQPE